ADRMIVDGCPKAPPRKARWPASVTTPVESPAFLLPLISWHHSQAFPCMSNKPKSLGRNLPTGFNRLRELRANQAYFVSSSSASPSDQRFTLPARQAYSHSAEVGSRYPDRLVKSGTTFIPFAYSPCSFGS